MSAELMRSYLDILNEQELNHRLTEMMIDPLDEDWRKAAAAGLLGLGLAAGGPTAQASEPVQQPTAITQPAKQELKVSKEAAYRAAADWLNKNYGTKIPTDRVDYQTFRKAVETLPGSGIYGPDSPYHKWAPAMRVAYAYNVKPNSGPGTISLGDASGQATVQKWMTDHGYNLQGKYIGSATK